MIGPAGWSPRATSLNLSTFMITHPSDLDEEEVVCCREFLYGLHHPPRESAFAEVRERLQKLKEETEELHREIESTYSYWEGRIDEFERQAKRRCKEQCRKPGEGSPNAWTAKIAHALSSIFPSTDFDRPSK